MYYKVIVNGKDILLPFSFFRILKNMDTEVHRTMEDSDHLKRLSKDTEEYDMFPISLRIAVNGQIVPWLVVFRSILNVIQLCPQSLQVERLLLSAPGSEGVICNRLQVLDSGRGEDELHRVARARFRNSSSVLTKTPSPRSS